MIERGLSTFIEVGNSVLRCMASTVAVEIDAAGAEQEESWRWGGALLQSESNSVYDRENRGLLWV